MNSQAVSSRHPAAQLSVPTFARFLTPFTGDFGTETYQKGKSETDFELISYAVMEL